MLYKYMTNATLFMISIYRNTIQISTCSYSLENRCKTVIFLYSYCHMDLSSMSSLFSHYRPRDIIDRELFFFYIKKYTCKNSQEYHHII